MFAAENYGYEVPWAAKWAITYDGYIAWLGRTIIIYSSDHFCNSVCQRNPSRKNGSANFNINRDAFKILVENELTDALSKANDANYQALFLQEALPPPPPPPPPAPTIIDGIEIDPNQIYNVNIFNSSGVLIASDPISGQKIIDLAPTNVTIKIISAEEITMVLTPTQPPQNPFYRLSDGTQIFLNDLAPLPTDTTQIELVVNLVGVP